MNKLTFFIVNFVVIFILVTLKVHFILAAVITMCVTMSTYMYVMVKKNKNRLSMLNYNCDPQAFIDLTEREIEKNKRSVKAVTYLNIDVAAGYMALNNYDLALNIFNEVDERFLNDKNGSLIVFNIYKAICLYELKQTEEAEDVYFNNIIKLLKNNPKLEIACDLFLAEREYYLGNFEIAYDKLKEIFNNNMSKRGQLSVLYKLGMIEVYFNDISVALENFKKVAEQGNTLGIAELSRQQLVILNNK